MNQVNETTEMWREIRAEEQEKHQKRKAENLAVLRSTTLPFQYRNGGDVVLIRAAGYPAIDFYTTTNRWRVGPRYMMGDANALVEYLWRRSPMKNASLK